MVRLDRRVCIVVLLALGGLVAGQVSIRYTVGTRLAPLPEWLGQTSSGVLTGVIAERENRTDAVQLRLYDVTFTRETTEGGTGETLPVTRTDDERVLLTVYTTGHTMPVPGVPGDLVRVGKVRLGPPRVSRVPGSFDYALFLRRQGVVATATTRGTVEPVGPAAWRWADMWSRWRLASADAILYSLGPTQAAALTEALLLGYRGHLDGATREAFQSSGVFHLIAISGLQLSLVAGGAFHVIRLLLVLILPLSRRLDVKPWAAVLAFIPLIGYGYLAGWSIATQRAVVMSSILLLAWTTGRWHQTWHALGVAALGLLLHDPTELFDPGFQLSCIATAALLWCAARWVEFSRRYVDQPQPARWSQQWIGRRVMIPVLTALSMTAAAWLATLPIVLHYFHALSPYSIPANLLVAPLASGVSLGIGFAALVTLPVVPDLSGVLFTWVGGLMEEAHRIATGLAALPGAGYRLPGPPLPGMVLMVGTLVWGMTSVRTRRSMIGCGILVVLGGLWPHPVPSPGQLHVAFLDVGQATATVLRTPAGHWSVVDAGGTRTDRFDIGEVISAYLWHYGVTDVERMVLSHPQSDHMAGAERMLRNFSVRELWLNAASYPVTLLQQARQRGTTVRRMIRAEQVNDGAVEFRLLPPVAALPGVGSDNDHSLAVEVSYGAHRILLPGDLEEAGERWLLRRGTVRPVTVLAAPHHGSRSSSSPEFVATTRPQHVVFSVGRDNRYRFPAREVVERWGQQGATLWRTDRHGTLVVATDGQALTIHDNQ